MVPGIEQNLKENKILNNCVKTTRISNKITNKKKVKIKNHPEKLKKVKVFNEYPSYITRDF